MDDGQKKYIVTDTLKNLFVTINDKLTKIADSYPLDIAHLNFKESRGEYTVTTELIHYPVVMGVTAIPENLETAGQYANLLNDYLNLQPGIYICRIVSFDLKTASGQLRTIYTPVLSFPVEVKENVTSANLGEFEVEIR
jgi:hypothetical protein